MKKTYIILMSLLFCLSQQIFADDDKKVIQGPIQVEWDETEERDLSAPQLHQDDTHVYVYTEKLLDNLTIGITDMQGNVHYEEVTTVPACMYYDISIESLPAGTYYLCVYQGSNYVIGMFNK